MEHFHNLCFGCHKCNNFGETRTLNMFDQLVAVQKITKIVKIFEQQFNIFLTSNPLDKRVFTSRVEFAEALYGRYPHHPGGIQSDLVFQLLKHQDETCPLPPEKTSGLAYYNYQLEKE